MMTQEEYVRDAIGLLSQLIATPSTSRNEKDAADIMEKAATMVLRHIVKPTMYG